MKRVSPVAVLGAFAVVACDSDPAPAPSLDATQAPPAASLQRPKPALLYLPDGGDEALTGTPPVAAPRVHAVPGGRCPPEMVDIRGAFCIDRYEASLVDVQHGREVSPYYHPLRSRTASNYQRWISRAATTGTMLAKTTPVPAPPPWQLEEDFAVMAVSRPHVIPSGYLSGTIADKACRAAGKRLCRPGEWVMACRGEGGSTYPYGEQYVEGACNVHRGTHPARLLHGNAGIHHTDPRLNTVQDPDGPLLTTTGERGGCASRWGSDAVFDMVGNLDEWVDDESGLFLGGFYSRGTRAGCDASISSHDKAYYDYSLGVRCCL